MQCGQWSRPIFTSRIKLTNNKNHNNGPEKNCPPADPHFTPRRLEPSNLIHRRLDIDRQIPNDTTALRTDQGIKPMTWNDSLLAMRTDVRFNRFIFLSLQIFVRLTSFYIGQIYNLPVGSSLCTVNGFERKLDLIMGLNPYGRILESIIRKRQLLVAVL